MNNAMRGVLTSIAAAGLIAIGASASAAPLACSSGVTLGAGAFTCTFSDSNTTELDGLVTFTVDWNGSDTLTVSAVAGALPGGVTLLGFDSFGFSSGLNFTALPASWNDNGAGNLDGFGNFTDTAGNPANGNQILTFAFVLSGTNDGFAANNKDANFAAHVKFNDPTRASCSAFFGNSDIPTKPLASTECTSIPHQETPEPSTLLLLGIGLIGLAAVGRGRLSGRV